MHTSSLRRVLSLMSLKEWHLTWSALIWQRGCWPLEGNKAWFLSSSTTNWRNLSTRSRLRYTQASKRTQCMRWLWKCSTRKGLKIRWSMSFNLLIDLSFFSSQWRLWTRNSWNLSSRFFSQTKSNSWRTCNHSQRLQKISKKMKLRWTLRMS